MLSPTDIQEQNDLAVERATSANQVPYLPFDQTEVIRWRARSGFPFPVLGDYIPPNYERVDSLFVDSSGLGKRTEPALTIDELCDYIELYLDENRSYAIRDVGQFQVYVNVFRSLQ